MQRADLLGVFDVNGGLVRMYKWWAILRIRTRVTGLEGQHDIQTTPIALTFRAGNPL